MKKLLLGLLLFPSVCFADRLGSLTRDSNVALSTQTASLSSGTAITGLNATEVLYMNSSNKLDGSQNFTFDDTSLFIGANSPIATYHIGEFSVFDAFFGDVFNVDIPLYAGIRVNGAGQSGFQFNMNNTDTTGTFIFKAGDSPSGNGFFINPDGMTNVVFRVFGDNSDLIFAYPFSDYLGLGTTTDLGSTVGIQARTTTDDSLIIRAVGAQTGNLIELQRADSSHAFSINSGGDIFIGNDPGVGGGVEMNATAGILTLQGYGNTNNESLNLDFETTNDQVNLYSTFVGTLSVTGMKLDARGGLNVISTATLVAPDSNSNLRFGVTDLPSGGGFGPQVAYPYINAQSNVNGTDVSAFRILSSTYSGGFGTGRFGDIEWTSTPGQDATFGWTINGNGGSIATRSMNLGRDNLSVFAPAVMNEYFTAIGTSSFKSTTTFNTAIDMSTAYITSTYYRQYSTTGTARSLYSFQDLIRGPGSSINRYRIKEFTNVKQSNNSITGAVGVSGATYVPERDMLLMVDNNNLTFHVFNAADLSTKLGEVSLSGFGDPEGMEYLWSIYDSSNQPVGCMLAITEEQTNQIVLSTWQFTNVNGTITKANSFIIMASGMWTPDASLGMESITYDPFNNNLIAAKQGGSMEIRIIHLDGTATPAAYEPFDAETLWSSSFTRINDLTFDQNTRTCIGIADETGAANANQDIFRFNCYTGELIEWWNNYVTDLGFNTTTWPQSEGIAITPDGDNLFVTSEGTNVAWLTRGSASAFTQTGSSITYSTADSITILDRGQDGRSIPLRLINDTNGFGNSDIDPEVETCMGLEYYDSNELVSTQRYFHRGLVCAQPNPLVGAVNQESGGTLRFWSTLGSGTHGTNTQVANLWLNEFGHTIVSSVTARDVGAKFQVIGSSDETQMNIVANLSQTTPLAVFQSSTGVHAFDVYVASANFPLGVQSSSITVPGMFNVQTSSISFFGVAVSSQSTPIANASGGATIDAEARNAINALLQSMRRWGFVQ